MNYQPVIDTTILNVQEITARSGRGLRIIDIACPGFHSQPGQFVMIQKKDGGFQWSYPYMVYENTDQGLKVIAAPDASLGNAAAGTPIVLWGANGKACHLNRRDIFIAEPATLQLILPLVHSCAAPVLIVRGREDDAPLSLLPEDTRFMTDESQIRDVLLHCEDASIYMALNIGTLEAIVPAQRADAAGACDGEKAFTNRLFVFVSTQIGCGIGACKACYLHSPDIAMGIPVCCNGPYLPYTSIDFEKDRKCFQTFL